MVEPLVLVLAITTARTLVQVVRAGVTLAQDRVLRRRVVTLTAQVGAGGLVLDRHAHGTILVLIGAADPAKHGESR